IVGNVGIVVDGDLVWATRYWGTHHGWGPVDAGDTAIGFLEEVQARGLPAIAEHVPIDDWSPTDAEPAEPAPRDDLQQPTREAIREICTAQSFQRGVNYYEEGRVRDVTVEGREVTARVRGSREYRTTVDLSANGFDPWCSCPYDYAGECKHVVAVLLTVADRFDDLFAVATDDDRQRDDDPTALSNSVEPDIDEVLAGADPETLRTFLEDVLDGDNDLRERFLAFVDAPTEKSLADYRRDINRRFEDAIGRRGIVEYDTHLQFEEYYDLAETYRTRGNDEQALTIYQAIAEAIRENLGRIDDSSGHYGDAVERAVEAYANCLGAADPTQVDRSDHIEYLFEQFESAEFGFVREYYDEALREVCVTEADLEHWLSLLEPHVPEFESELSPREQIVVSSYLHVLEELDERDALERVLEEVYDESTTFYRQYIDLLLAGGRDDRAADVIEEGLDTFRFVPDIQRLAADFYRERDPERYREVLQTLVVRHEDWEAYEELEQACSDDQWESTRHTIVTQLGRLDPEQLIELYLHDGEREKAFSKVLDREELELFRRYRSEVADIDPEAYFEAYRDRLEPYLADDTGRDHYRTVIDHLRELDAIGLEEPFEAFLDHLREKHANRPAFLDELEQAGF
ncbi:MAG: SWIM zinc finger family protein, partial [Halapricum sp.]